MKIAICSIECNEEIELAVKLKDAGNEVHIFAPSLFGYRMTEGIKGILIHRVESIPGCYSDLYTENATKLINEIGGFEELYQLKVF